MFNAHGMQPDVVFGVLDMLGAQAGRILVVGCQPASLELEMGLSEPVAAAVDEAASRPPACDPGQRALLLATPATPATGATAVALAMWRPMLARPLANAG